MSRKKQTLWELHTVYQKKTNHFFNCKVDHDFLKNPNNVELKSPRLDTSTFLGNYSEIYIDF